MSNYKSPIRVVKADFKVGEIDPMLQMRHDTELLVSGARTMTNMMVSQVGPVMRRPGTVTQASLPQRCRLLEFRFDAGEEYVCAFGNNALYIHSAQTGVHFATFSGSTDCPWTATTVWEMSVIQKGDVMIIVHPSFRMRRLRRVGLTSFVMELLYFTTDSSDAVYNQPYIRYAPSNVTMAISDVGVGGGRTLTCSQPLFTPAWVGERIRIYNCEVEITAVGGNPTSVATATVKQQIETRLGIAPFLYTKGSIMIEVTHVQHGLQTGATVLIGAVADWPGTGGNLVDGSRVITVIDEDHYRINADPAGIASASGDGGGSSVRISTLDPTRSWMEQVWSDRRGWPRAITLHENRLWLGGSTSSPTFLSGSAVGDYYDHNVRDGLDDESVQGTISTLQGIRHLVSSRTLQIFCENSEAIAETQQGQPITPANMKITTQTSYGASDVRPQLFDGATLFCQRSGKSIRELLFDYNTDSHVASPVSIASSHLINQPRDMAVALGTANRPEQYAFIVNGDGTVAIYHSIRNEKLFAWAPMVNGNGSFDSVCVVGTHVFFSVLRHGTYHLDKLPLDATTLWLDGAVTIDIRPALATVWALGALYANRTVSVSSVNNYLGRYTANGSGSITIPFAVGIVTAGYDYPVELVPNPPDKELTDGPMTGEIRRIVSATVHWHSSTAVAVNGQEQLLFNPLSDPTEAAVRKSGKRRVRLLGYDRDPVISITQPTPGPLTVLGMSFEVSL